MLHHHIPLARWIRVALLLVALLASPGWAADDPTVLITGANRGIGLELARQYAERDWFVIATARRPDAADDLKAIQAEHPRLEIVQLDVTDHARIDALAAQWQDRPIDILINNAGISGGHENAKFGQMNYDTYYQVHAVNVIGPTKMAEALLPSIAQSDQKKIINITSGQGSIADTWGCCTFYRSSKASLNMVSRNLSLELKRQGITVGLISPGFVRTNFTPGLDHPAMISPEQSASMVIAVIDDYDLEKTGTFMAHDGRELPW
ncbi:MAG: SDR family oxidoreductase [Chromatiales bacterium]|nr:MAG: SDR family oxidoreductase [Chromatiales bacterium]